MWFLLSLAIGVLGVWLAKAYAIKHKWLDIPNERSFHREPVPRIGGLGILLPVLLGLVWVLARPVEGEPLTWLAGLIPALLVALVSFIDDRSELPRAVRFGGHFVAAMAVVLMLRASWSGMAWPLLGVALPAWLAGLLLVVWIIGLTNSYNFMDGIDGIAAIQGLVAVLAWVLLLTAECVENRIQAQELLLVCLAGGLLAFLFFNWAPASIFMGDTGSTFLGFTLASLPLMAASSGMELDRSLEAGVLFTWPFIADTGMTFCRRLIFREAIFNAHRTHVYQVLAGTYRTRRLGHRLTSALYGILALIGVGLFWTSGPLWAKLAVLLGLWVAVTAWTFGLRRESVTTESNSAPKGETDPQKDPFDQPTSFNFMPFDIFLSPPEITEAEYRMVETALSSGFIAPVGPQVNGFEKGLADYLGFEEMVALSSGTAAIHLGLRALGVGPGDCVLCPDLTFVASVNPVRYLGAEPVLVDVQESNWAMDPELAAEAIRSLKSRGRQVRALVVVHAYGIPADVQPLVELARREGVAVLEDCAGAFGTRIGERHVGSFGDAAAFSFNGNKVLTTSGGGALYIRDEEARRLVRSWANQGKRPGAVGYYHDSLGYNYKLSNISAAIGIAQLETVGGRLSRKRLVLQGYHQRLADLPGVRFLPQPAYGQGNCWMTCLGLQSREQVEGLIASLREHRIESSPIWLPMHRQEANRELHCFGGEVSDKIHREFLSVPSGSALKPADLDRICEVIRKQLLVAS